MWLAQQTISIDTTTVVRASAYPYIGLNVDICWDTKVQTMSTYVVIFHRIDFSWGRFTARPVQLRWKALVLVCCDGLVGLQHSGITGPTWLVCGVSIGAFEVPECQRQTSMTFLRIVTLLAPSQWFRSIQHGIIPTSKTFLPICSKRVESSSKKLSATLLFHLRFFFFLLLLVTSYWEMGNEQDMTSTGGTGNGFNQAYMTSFNRLVSKERIRREVGDK